MTTPTGQISLADVNTELGYSSTAQIGMNDSAVRTLAGVPSGAISMQNLQGKSNRVSISYTYSANTANASLDLSTISGYSSGKSDITVTVNSGVYLYATSTSNYGLNLTGGASGDTLTIVNNGYIMGQGGIGGGGSGATASYQLPTVGGVALNFGFNLTSATVNNTNGSAYIGGGGGGGGSSQYVGGGGGAGGGTGGWGEVSCGCSGNVRTNGGAGGSIGSSGSNGQYSGAGCTGGGGGGRIFAGTGGAGGTGQTYLPAAAGQGGGSGGGGGCGGPNTSYWGSAGGSANASGSGGTNGGAGGGGWGASGGSSTNGWSGSNTGRAGGKAVNLNGKSITWTSGNTTRVYGAIS